MTQFNKPVGSGRTIAPLTNVNLTATALVDTQVREESLPGLVCLYGRAGYGKSSAAYFLTGEYMAYYVAMKSVWTVKHLLTQILSLMGPAQPGQTISKLMDQVCESLADSRRPLIIDQADYLVDKGKANIFMDLYEGSMAPILLIGEEGLSSTLKSRNETVHSRVLHWIEAQPASANDCRLLADLYCPEVVIADDLLDQINATVAGCTRRVAVNVNRIRNIARPLGWDRVDLARWGERQLISGEPHRA